MYHYYIMYGEWKYFVKSYIYHWRCYSSKKMELVITNIAKELNIDNYLYGTKKQCVCAIIKNEISNNNICPQKS